VNAVRSFGRADCGQARTLTFAGLGAVAAAALLLAAITATAVGLFWATAALERWLDAAPTPTTAAPATGTSSPVVAVDTATGRDAEVAER
jgi:hypothetical protein